MVVWKRLSFAVMVMVVVSSATVVMVGLLPDMVVGIVAIVVVSRE